MEKKQILIAVKAYPNPSKSYGETVCCAGVDLATGKLIRLYPIPFRDLDDQKKFKKYNVIEILCFTPRDDKRPESHRVNSDSIRILEWWDTKDRWARRKSVVLPTLSASMCTVLKEAKDHDKSLALIRPDNVAFEWQKTRSTNQFAREACYAQLSFLNRKKEAIEKIPWDFYYDFRCQGLTDCPGHRLPIIGWEIGQAYRDWRQKYKTEGDLLEKIRERWLGGMCSDKQDTYFFVGNMKRFRDKFMVLGTFYPPRGTS